MVTSRAENMAASVRKATARRQWIEEPHLHVRQGGKGAEELVFAGGVEIVDEQANANAARGRVAQLAQEAQVDAVALELVVLTSSDARKRAASGELASRRRRRSAAGESRIRPARRWRGSPRRSGRASWRGCRSRRCSPFARAAQAGAAGEAEQRGGQRERVEETKAGEHRRGSARHCRGAVRHASEEGSLRWRARRPLRAPPRAGGELQRRADDARCQGGGRTARHAHALRSRRRRRRRRVRRQGRAGPRERPTPRRRRRGRWRARRRRGRRRR